MPSDMIQHSLAMSSEIPSHQFIILAFRTGIVAQRYDLESAGYEQSNIRVTGPSNYSLAFATQNVVNDRHSTQMKIERPFRLMIRTTDLVSRLFIHLTLHTSHHLVPPPLTPPGKLLALSNTPFILLIPAFTLEISSSASSLPAPALP
jgi:hypothetical protein